MSELIKIYDKSENLQKKLMATASAFILTAYVASADVSIAKDDERPTVWIELGGQMELMQGLTDPLTAPFMTALSPTPGPYSGDIFLRGQKPSHRAFGLEGKVSFEPENSDWVFAAGIRYGRSHSKRHIHNQTQLPPYHATFYGYHYTVTPYPAAFADTKSDSHESHTILDFTAGKDVGLGMFGRNNSSTLNVGVRFAQFTQASSLDIQARPILQMHPNPYIPAIPKYFAFDQYGLSGNADRNFRGIGPSLSWNSSENLFGNSEVGELTLDWSVNAAALFGRQKAKISHNTQQHHAYGRYHSPVYPLIYQTGNTQTRSRSVVVPNVGGSIGFSVKYPNAKISLGYRADFFLGAMDTGIDVRHTKDLGFHGPYANISIGLGG